METMHMLKGISNANEELQGGWTKIGLIKAKDHVKKSVQIV